MRRGDLPVEEPKGSSSGCRNIPVLPWNKSVTTSVSSCCGHQGTYYACQIRAQVCHGLLFNHRALTYAQSMHATEKWEKGEGANELSQVWKRDLAPVQQKPQAKVAPSQSDL
ncbi:unnamed protein product [Dibothriocephalus latus]|uniref:Uncharacterized protein n=1 Tax=Dibothriocephalus latus TaxID=60516 RepID=A0A3P7L677_DIBLA|nr:unnamed protein product [Dibothriocephalus latus]